MAMMEKRENPPDPRPMHKPSPRWRRPPASCYMTMMEKRASPPDPMHNKPPRPPPAPISMVLDSPCSPRKASNRLSAPPGSNIVRRRVSVSSRYLRRFSANFGSLFSIGSRFDSNPINTLRCSSSVPDLASAAESDGIKSAIENQPITTSKATRRSIIGCQQNSTKNPFKIIISKVISAQDLASINVNYHFSVRSNSYSCIGKKQKDEDRYYTSTEGSLGGCQPQIRSKQLPQSHLVLSKLSVIAVIDGHGGQACADFIVNNLDRVVNQCQAFSKPVSLNVQHMLEEGAREIIASLASDFLEYARDTGDTSGACLVIAFCYKTYICVANVGDCLAVFIGATGKIKLPSRVHRCSVKNERDRIQRAGGQVDKKGRLMGCLAPSRALGDLDVHLALPGTLTAEPHVQTLDLARLGGLGGAGRRAAAARRAAPRGGGGGGGAAASSLLPLPTRGGGARPVLVLGTDGVWDALKMKEAGRLARRWLAEADWDVAAAAPGRRLVEEALRLGSRDDATATVVVF